MVPCRKEAQTVCIRGRQNLKPQNSRSACGKNLENKNVYLVRVKGIMYAVMEQPTCDAMILHALHDFYSDGALTPCVRKGRLTISHLPVLFFFGIAVYYT